jgi:succinate dehydrogenase flavin-adding protein (antitoxin of CptAB toxin-antitoxin module)
MEDIEILKKKLIYRSKSFGYRELNVLFKNFLNENLDKLSYIQLSLLLDKISNDDSGLKDYLLEGKNLNDLLTSL